VPTLTCPNANCREQVDDWLTHCRECGQFIGYPNKRRAQGMRPALEVHFKAARDDAVARGAQRQVEALTACLTNAVATINVPPRIVATMVLDQPYLSYHRALERQLRLKAEDEYHAHRLRVDATIHPGYEKEVIYAALNPNGVGLKTYGAVTIQLNQRVLENRSSLLRENAFHFFERFRLGDAGSSEQPGWRAEWSDRMWLGIAHLAADLTDSTDDLDLPGLVLTIGDTRAEDRLIEIHVHGQITVRNVDRVTLDDTLNTEDARLDWSFAKEKLEKTRVEVTERVAP